MIQQRLDDGCQKFVVEVAFFDLFRISEIVLSSSIVLPILKISKLSSSVLFSSGLIESAICKKARFTYSCSDKELSIIA